MRKKKNNITEFTPAPNNHKKIILTTLAIFCIAGISAWKYNKHLQVKAQIKIYEAAMNKRTYEPCSYLDEIGDKAKITYWDENDPELKGFPREEGTGMYLPIKDRNGKIIKEPPTSFLGEIKSMHIPFLRGYLYSDGYGASYCLACSKAAEPEAISICNDKNAYYKINQEFTIEDLDEANPSLVQETANEESSQNTKQSY